MKVPATARGWVEVTTPADAEGKRGISMVRRMKRSIVKAEWMDVLKDWLMYWKLWRRMVLMMILGREK
jgi:hypothetical protein